MGLDSHENIIRLPLSKLKRLQLSFLSAANISDFCSVSVKDWKHSFVELRFDKMYFGYLESTLSFLNQMTSLRRFTVPVRSQ